MKNFKEVLNEKNKLALIVQSVKSGTGYKVTVHFPKSGETKIMFGKSKEIIIQQLEQAGYIVRSVD